MIVISFGPERKTVSFQHVPSELLEAKDCNPTNFSLRYSVFTSQKSREIDILMGVLRRKGIKFQDVRIALSVELAAFKDISEIDEVLETLMKEAQLPKHEFVFAPAIRAQIQQAFSEGVESRQSSSISS